MRSIGVGEVRPTDWNAADEVGSGSTTMAVPSGCWQVTGGIAAELVPALAAEAIEGFGSLVLAHPPSTTQPASASGTNLFDMYAPIRDTPRLDVSTISDRAVRPGDIRSIAGTPKAVARQRFDRYMAAMRTEIQNIVDDIKQSVGLLRRHL